MKREVNMRMTKMREIEEGSDGKINLHSPKPEPVMQADGRINTDPLGSWTGTATDNIMDKPVQDVDDL